MKNQVVLSYDETQLVTLGVLRTCLNESLFVLSAKLDLMHESLNENESLSEHTNILSPKKTSDTVDSSSFLTTKRVLHTNEVAVISILNVSRCESRWARRILCIKSVIAPEFWNPFCLRFCRFKFKFKMKNTVDIVQKRKKAKFKLKKKGKDKSSIRRWQ